MDTLTHGLAGALLARALPSTRDEDLDRRLTRREAWVGFAAAMLPDADVFASPFSAEFYITQHRALTHSFVMLPVWVAALTAVAALRLPPALGPRGSAPRRVAIRRLGAVVALGLVSHILLDWITSWGTMFFAPLSWTRYMLDWTFIVDLPLSGLLALSLVGVRVVKKRSFPRSRTAARAGLLAAAAYVGLCGVRHGEALRLASGLGKETALRAAIPQPGSPDRWLLLSDDGPAVTAAFVDLGKRGREGARAPDAEDLARTGFRSGLVSLVRHLGAVYRSRDDLGPRVIEKSNGPFARRTLDSGVAGVFGRFARFPAAREEAKGGNVEVLLRDVRFGYLSNEVDPFTYLVRYAPDGTVLFAGFPSSRWTQANPTAAVRAGR
jgi:membrane-bound metal-dependent hydrolase YbcI (DUF457 family)